MIKLFGDIILDKWIYGVNNKISPESASLVLLEKETKFSLGGAANLALSFKNLNLRFKLFGIIGKDDESKILINLLKKNKINYFFKQTRNCTTVKTRMIGNFNQQIMRLDKENINQDFLINKMIKKIKSNDVVVISDYNKGLIKNDSIKKILRKIKNVNRDRAILLLMGSTISRGLITTVYTNLFFFYFNYLIILFMQKKASG